MKIFFTVLKSLSLIEMRSKELFISVSASLFMVICLLSVGVSTSFLDPHSTSKIFPVVFWLAVIVSASLSLGRSFENDLRSSIFAVLLAAKSNLRLLFICRCIISIAFLLLATIAGFYMQSVLVNLNSDFDFLQLVSVCLVISVSVSALGNLFSIMSAGSHIRAAFLPLMLLPCSFPVFFCANELTYLLLKQPEFLYSSSWMYFALILSAVYLMLGSLLFPYAVKANVAG